MMRQSSVPYIPPYLIYATEQKLLGEAWEHLAVIKKDLTVVETRKQVTAFLLQRGMKGTPLNVRLAAESVISSYYAG